VQENSVHFDEARCVAESPWIVEGEVQRVATVTAMQWHPWDKKHVMMTTVSGIYLKNARTVKGSLPASYHAGIELIRIPYDRCGKRFEREWEDTGTRVRIYGRNDPLSGPDVIVPHHNYVVPLRHHIEPLPEPLPPGDGLEPERLSWVVGELRSNSRLVNDAYVSALRASFSASQPGR
jgi:hypothetical protein